MMAARIRLSGCSLGVKGTKAKPDREITTTDNHLFRA
jgi:hypothetical protein